MSPKQFVEKYNIRIIPEFLANEMNDEDTMIPWSIILDRNVQGYTYERISLRYRTGLGLLKYKRNWIRVGGKIELATEKNLRYQDETGINVQLRKVKKLTVGIVRQAIHNFEAVALAVPPTAEDIVYSLQIDLSDYVGGMDMWDWFKATGMEPSKEAEQSFKVVSSLHYDVTRKFGQEFLNDLVSVREEDEGVSL